MDNVVTALMAKLELLFGKAEDSYLAFMIPGLPVVEPRELAFGRTEAENGLSAQEALNAAANFARLANQIPSVGSRMLSDGRMLWSVYETVLTQAVVASGDLTLEEQTDLLNAEALLNQPAWEVYKKYQAAYWAAEEEYNSTKLSMENSSDPQAREKLSSQLAQLQAKKDQAKALWISQGYKELIEGALFKVEHLSQRNPQTHWQEWEQDFSESANTDLHGYDFYDTYPWPDSLDTDPPIQWMTLRIDSSEIQGLSAMVSSASRELVAELATGSSASEQPQALNLDILNLSVQLARVEIIRPWLEPLIFSSRAWKWAHPGEPLSDGLEPPHGILPAYSTEIVFARDLEIELKQDIDQNKLVVNNLQAGRPAFVGSLPLTDVSHSEGPGGEQTQKLQMEGIQIIAFICQKLPKSPDPDPTLNWQGLVPIPLPPREPRIPRRRRRRRRRRR